MKIRIHSIKFAHNHANWNHRNWGRQEWGIPSVVPIKEPGEHDRLALCWKELALPHSRGFPWLVEADGKGGTPSKTWGTPALREAPTGGTGSVVSSPKPPSHHPAVIQGHWVDWNRAWKQEAASQNKRGNCLQNFFILVLSGLITSSFLSVRCEIL